MSTNWLRIRAAAILGAGLIFMGYEVFFVNHPDYGVLAVIAAMLGLPFADWADFRRNRKDDEGS